MLFDMDRCINIISYDSLIYENSVLVVITFPCCESDENVTSESKLTVVCSRTVCDSIAGLYLVADGNDRTLVDACALVGSLILSEHVCVYCTVCCSNFDLVCCNEGYNTVVRCNDAYAGVLSCTVFHTCSDDRCLRLDERYCLTLHVGAHEGTVSVVVTKERDK